jgi:hypothetical protein
MSIIMAIDPGLTSGVVTLDTISPKVITTHELSFEELVKMLDDLDAYGIPDAYVCESYTITARTVTLSRQYDALEIIGVLRYFSISTGNPLYLYKPYEAKSFCNNAKLKDIGWYVPGKEHAMDAARHLFLWCVKQDIIRFAGERPTFNDKMD